VNGLTLLVTRRTDPYLLGSLRRHYSQPDGFVGRSICYAVFFDWVYYGHIVGGSATRFLPNRNEFLGTSDLDLIVNNCFFHIEKYNGKYPCRNFGQKVLARWRQSVQEDWKRKYGDILVGFESLVEIPRTGEVYRRDGWSLIGQTKGFTCKRIAGKSSDDWTGKRVWNTTDLRPKHVFARSIF
jgi:hypothetical protein